MNELKTYQATSMAEALAEVKRDLGREAVILHTRSVRKGRLFGLFGGTSMWEVTAAPNVNVLPRAPKGRYVPVENTPVPVPRSDHPAAEVAATGQLADIQQMLQSLVSQQDGEGGGKLPATLQEFHDRLCRQEVDEKIATDAIVQLRMELTGQELADRGIVRERLIDEIASRIPCDSAPVEPGDAMRGRVVALVGPTGVGKTTTVGKLAANLKLKEGKRVGLITMDTYRIAAVDQLKTYAEIIEVPLRTALTPSEMHQCIYALRGVDVILIDTVGRSQNDRLRLNQLRGFLSAADPDEVHLVVAATANRRCAQSILTQFTPLGVNRIIVTKLDEADACGMVLNVASKGKAPMSFVSSGQEVPDDIASADPRELARLILGDPEHAAERSGQ